MKKLVLAALLTTFTFGAAAAAKISFGVSATYPPFESMDANNLVSISTWPKRCANKCRQNVPLPTTLLTA